MKREWFFEILVLNNNSINVVVDSIRKLLVHSKSARIFSFKDVYFHANISATSFPEG